MPCQRSGFVAPPPGHLHQCGYWQFHTEFDTQNGPGRPTPPPLGTVSEYPPVAAPHWKSANEGETQQSSREPPYASLAAVVRKGTKMKRADHDDHDNSPETATSHMSADGDLWLIRLSERRSLQPFVCSKMPKERHAMHKGSLRAEPAAAVPTRTTSWRCKR